MRDRLPEPGKENRVRITQDDGKIVEGVLSYADGATVQGSAYCKANVLPDEVCDALGVDGVTAEPKDALYALALPSGNSGKVVFFVKDQNGTPLQYCTVTIGSDSAVTNQYGCISFTKAAPQSLQYTVVSPLDIGGGASSSGTVMFVVGEITVVKVVIVIAASPGNIAIITNSGNYVLSKKVSTFDIFCIGGGGSGASSVINVGVFAGSDALRSACGATGGGGGLTSTRKGVQNTGTITVSIGAGATSDLNTLYQQVTDGIYRGYGAYKQGKQGGTTTVSIGSTVVSAGGGTGGDAATTVGQSYPVTAINGSAGGSGSGASFAHDTKRKAGYSGSNGNNGEGFSVDVRPYRVDGGSGQGKTTTAFEESSGTAYSPAGGSAIGYIDYLFPVGLASPEAAKGLVGTSGAEAVAITTTQGTLTTNGNDGMIYGGGGGATVVVANYTNVGAYMDYKTRGGNGADGVVILRW